VRDSIPTDEKANRRGGTLPANQAIEGSDPHTKVVTETRQHVSIAIAGPVCIRRLNRPGRPRGERKGRPVNYLDRLRAIKFQFVGPGASFALSGQAPQPVGDRSPDLVRGVFLDEMDSLYCLLG
jgi:hypothetical protein